MSKLSSCQLVTTMKLILAFRCTTLWGNPLDHIQHWVSLCADRPESNQPPWLLGRRCRYWHQLYQIAGPCPSLQWCTEEGHLRGWTNIKWRPTYHRFLRNRPNWHFGFGIRTVSSCKGCPSLNTINPGNVWSIKARLIFKSVRHVAFFGSLITVRVCPPNSRRSLLVGT